LEILSFYSENTLASVVIDIFFLIFLFYPLNMQQVIRQTVKII